jgi:hypothetical protein
MLSKQQGYTYKPCGSCFNLALRTRVFFLSLKWHSLVWETYYFGWVICLLDLGKILAYYLDKITLLYKYDPIVIYRTHFVLVFNGCLKISIKKEYHYYTECVIVQVIYQNITQVICQNITVPNITTETCTKYNNISYHFP